MYYFVSNKKHQEDSRAGVPAGVTSHLSTITTWLDFKLNLDVSTLN